MHRCAHERCCYISEACAQWLFRVWTKSRAEKMVESRIASLGLEPWLPTVTDRRRWSDRWREAETSLFPGFLFARPAAKWHTVLHTPGVLTVVKGGGRPAQISDDFIQQLRRAITRGGTTVQPMPAEARFEPEDEVIVQDGPLRGIRGVVREVRAARQLIIWVSAIARGMGLKIGAALVAPVQ